MIQLPQLYTKHLKKHLNSIQFLILSILINLIQEHRWIKLENLAFQFPSPIKEKSRIKKIQRFLPLKQLNIETLWFPIILEWIENQYETQECLFLVIDRSQWRSINLLMVSLVYNKRAIPLYFKLLPKKGNSNLQAQKEVLNPVISLLENYKLVVLGDREFCNVDLARWLGEMKTPFSLRLKKNEYVELEEHIWFQLKDLGLTPGSSLYYQGVKVTLSKGFGEVNLAAKWSRNYRGKSQKEPWYILTNLRSLSAATEAYSQRMGIEEMFRDFKLGGYNIEGTQVTGERLIALILLGTLAYSMATFQGNLILRKGVAQYVSRPSESKRRYRRNSGFSIGLKANSWLNSLSFFAHEVEQLIAFVPQKRAYYSRGLRAATIIQSAF
ncbi:IS4 family transposase [Gloeothece verrucosa]|uniref:Transposase IS4 family protein n=1 Tax=Gloeothece verrucosa (strain PCC 7822) TaxID=497965 RepID=E0UMY6_GLOV7|nr:IS4 family transposase [Gloeothece verrucosa]ADN18316.1 transposase IS4 family protein [Gloeothece verrucosa PCC 7822]